MTSKRGTYTLTLVAGAATGDGGNASLGGSETFVTTGKPTNVTALAIDRNQVKVSWSDNSYNETSYLITRADDASFTKNVKTFSVPAEATPPGSTVAPLLTVIAPATVVVPTPVSVWPVCSK